MRRYVWVAAIVLALCGGYSGLWLVAAGQVERGLAAQVAAWRADGWEVAMAARRPGGFPLWLAFADDRIQAANQAEGTRVTAETVQARARPWNFDRWTIAVGGPVTVAWRGPDRAHRVTSWAERTHARLLFGSDGFRDGRVTLENADLTLDEAPMAAVAKGVLRAQRSGDQDAPLTAALTLTGVDLPAGEGGAFGDRISELDLAASLLGPPPDSFAREAVAAWRDHGGTLEVTRARLAWGPLGVNGTGTLTLDESFRPLGAFSARFRGLDLLIESLLAHGAINREIALAVTLAVRFLERPAEDGSRMVEIGLTAQDGWLYLGPVALLPLAPIL